MIESIRKFTKSGFSKALICFIAGSFIFLGIGDMFRSRIKNNYLSVGKESYSKEHISQLANREEKTYRRNNPKVSDEKIRKIPFNEVALQKLIAENLLIQESEKINLIFSDEAVLQEIVNTKFFQTDNKFNQLKFDNFLIDNQISEAEYLALVKSNKKMQTLRDISNFPLQSDFPETAKIIYRIENQEKVFDLYTVALDEITTSPNSEEEIQNFFNAKIELFTTPEQRKINIINLTCAAVEDKVTLTDEEITQEYNNQTASIVQKRDLTLMTLATEEDAKKAQLMLNSDTDFDEVAELLSTSKSSSNIGAVTKEELFPEFKEIIFSKNEGEYTDIIKGDFGYHIFKINKVLNAEKPSLDTIKPTIIASLKKAESCNLAFETFNKIEEDINAGLSTSEVAMKYNLNINSNFNINETNAINLRNLLNINEEDLFDLFKSIFGSAKLNDPLLQMVGNGQYLVYEITNSSPKHYPELSEVREQVEVKVSQDKLLTIARQQTSEFVAKTKKNGEGITLPANFTIEKNLKFSENFNRPELTFHTEQILKLTSGYFTATSFDAKRNVLTFIQITNTEYPEQIDPSSLRKVQLSVPNLLRNLISESYSLYLESNYPINVNEVEDE